MQIGELAKRSGLAASRIRFYEQRGLLVATRQANGYRAYAPDALVTLNIIISAQQAGFALEDISGLLPEKGAGWRHDDLLDALQRKMNDVKAMQKRLSQTRKEIEALIASIKSRPESMTCTENADRVLDQFKTATLARAQSKSLRMAVSEWNSADKIASQRRTKEKARARRT